MRGRRLALLPALALLAFVGSDPAHAQSFYEGKTLRIVVGFAAGGGFDTYARAIGRHLGKHIPGNPAIIVENMPGAGSLILANQLYRVEAERARLGLDPVTGEELEKMVADLFTLDPTLVARLKEILLN